MSSAFATGGGKELEERGSMARALCILFAVGGVLGLTAIPFSLAATAVGVTAIPLSRYLSGAEQVGLIAVCAVAFAACAAIALGWRRLPRGAFEALLALGTVLVSVGAYFVSEAPSDAEMYYVWIALYASYFMTRARAMVQLAFVGLCYGLVLGLGPATGAEASRWLITIGTLTVTALVFGRIADRMRRRVADAERSEGELGTSLSLLEATLESTADGILVVDREGAIVSFNRVFQEMWRIPDEVVRWRDDGRALAFVRDQLADPEQFLRKVQQVNDRPEAESHDVIQFKDGRVFERYSRPQRGSDGQIHGRVWSFRDVTEREATHTRLRRLAERDPLTGLLNRTRFEEELSQQAAYTARYGAGAAVLLLDLDDFKHVNDSLGHRTGDALLTSIADLLSSRLRESDVLARLGGDEFAVLLRRAGTHEAELVADELLESVRRHRMVFRGKRVRVTTSIGVAPISPGEVETAEDALVRADVAMYRAKEAGRDRVSTYAGPEQRLARLAAGETSAERIRGALESDRLTLYAQPILELRSDRISHHELLLRMLGEDGVLLPPGAFLPSAERSGAIREIDAWVARRAIRLISAERQSGRRLRLEVNLSGRTLGDASLLRAIAADLRATSIEPGDLIFEVSETAAVANLEEAEEFAARLTQLGCRFALDDFGAGFHSFHYLRTLPVDYLKIDGDFVAELAHSATDRAVVQAIVHLARQLGKRTIAEHVGDERTTELLREYGVDYAQGYHVGHARPIVEIWDGVAAAAAEVDTAAAERVS